MLYGAATPKACRCGGRFAAGETLRDLHLLPQYSLDSCYATVDKSLVDGAGAPRSLMMVDGAAAPPACGRAGRFAAREALRDLRLLLRLVLFLTTLNDGAGAPRSCGSARRFAAREALRDLCLLLGLVLFLVSLNGLVFSDGASPPPTCERARRFAANEALT